MNNLPKPIIQIIAQHNVLSEISQLNKRCYSATQLLLYKKNIQRYLYNKDILIKLLTLNNIIPIVDRVYMIFKFAREKQFELMHLVIKLSPQIHLNNTFVGAVQYHTQHDKMVCNEMQKYTNYISEVPIDYKTLIIPINEQYQLITRGSFMMIVDNIHVFNFYNMCEL